MGLTDEFEYFYVVAIAPGFCGSLIVPQRRPENGGDNPDGFNIASGHTYIQKQFGFRAIIQSWKKTTQKRKEEFDAYIFSHNAPKQGAQIHHLQLINNGEKFNEPTKPTDGAS